MQERDLTGVERARSADMGQRGDHKPGKRVGSLLLEPGRERLCVKRRRVRRSPWRLGWHRRGKRFELSPHVPPRSAVARRHQVGCSRPRRILALHEALLCVEVEDGLSLVIPREGLHRKLVCHRGDWGPAWDRSTGRQGRPTRPRRPELGPSGRRRDRALPARRPSAPLHDRPRGDQPRQAGSDHDHVRRAR